MTLAAAQTLHYIAGNRVQLEFTVELGGSAIPLNGMDIRFVAANSSLDAVLSTEDSSQSAVVTVTDAEGGEFTVTIEAQYTAPLLGTYRWQCEIEDSNGGISTVARGFLTFSRNLISTTS